MTRTKGVGRKPQDGDAIDEVSQLRGWLAESGFPHELRVGKTLGLAGWDLSHSEYYFDPVEAHYREIDIIARVAPPRTITDDTRLQAGDAKIRSIASPAVTINISLVVECKKSTEPWVVFTSPSLTKKLHYPLHFTPYGPGRFAIFRALNAYAEDEYERSGDERALSDADFIRLPLFSVGGRLGHGITREQPDRNKNQAYEAVESVLRAATYYSRENGRAILDATWRHDITIYLPVVILQGSLYECSVEPDGVEVLRKVDESLLLTRDVHSDEDPVIVRVVTTADLDRLALEWRAAALEITARTSRPDSEFWIWAAEDYIADVQTKRRRRDGGEEPPPPPEPEY